MLHIQRYFREGGTCEDLRARFAVTSRPHGSIPNLVLHRYDQYASPFAEPLVQECRGIILDHDDNFRVVSMAFRKFFNHGEALAAEIDWTTARVEEKLDGSLCTIFPYQGAWHVQTSGMPDASSDVNGFGISFEALFWQTFRAEGLTLPPVSDACSYIFELTGPFTRVVVRYPEHRLTILGARRLGDLEEISAEDARVAFQAPHARVPKVYAADDMPAVLADVATLRGVEDEGRVVVDAVFRRVKVKGPDYLLLHHTRGGLSRKAIFGIAMTGEGEEVFTTFPEFRPIFEEAEAKIAALRASVEEAFARIRHIAEQKAFAKEACATGFSDVLFAMRKGKTCMGYLFELFATYPHRVHALAGWNTREETAE